MKNKRTYSLTAKERKARRYGTDNKKPEQPKKSAVSDATDVRASAEAAMLAGRKRSKTSAIIIGGVVCVAILLIIAALIAPVIMYFVNPYRGYKKVIARFNLSDDTVIEYVIDEDEYDIAATNFIFLAKNGYFDNTVFFDAQNGWLRFGGYEQQPFSNMTNYSVSHNKRHSESYVKSFSALPNSRFSTWTYKFGYELKPDEKGTDQVRLEKEGVLAIRYKKTSTEFQFSYMEQAPIQINIIENGNKKTTDEELTMVGHVLNQKSLDNIKRIARTKKVNGNISVGYLWEPPTPDIRIKNVKIYNLKSSKWDNFDFIKYVSGKDNSSRLYSSWNIIM